jgi:hypothetical protein
VNTAQNIAMKWMMWALGSVFVEDNGYEKLGLQ